MESIVMNGINSRNEGVRDRYNLTLIQIQGIDTKAQTIVSGTQHHRILYSAISCKLLLECLHIISVNEICLLDHLQHFGIDHLFNG